MIPAEINNNYIISVCHLEAYNCRNIDWFELEGTTYKFGLGVSISVLD